MHPQSPTSYAVEPGPRLEGLKCCFYPSTQSSARFFQEVPSEEPQVLRGSRGYVRKVFLDYETQLFVTPKRKQGEWRMCQNLK